MSQEVFDRDLVMVLVPDELSECRVVENAGRSEETAQGGTLRRFAIAGADQVYHWADAVIEGSTVLLSSPAVPSPVHARYAWDNNPIDANLYNKEGLPAAGFRTDRTKK